MRETVYLPKQGEVVGFKNMCLMNEEAFMTGYYDKTQPLWTIIFRGKYARGSDLRKTAFASQQNSMLWKSVVHVLPKAIASARIEVKNGNNTRFWLDN